MVFLKEGLEQGIETNVSFHWNNLTYILETKSLKKLKKKHLRKYVCQISRVFNFANFSKTLAKFNTRFFNSNELLLMNFLTSLWKAYNEPLKLAVVVILNFRHQENWKIELGNFRSVTQHLSHCLMKMLLNQSICTMIYCSNVVTQFV